MNPEGSKERELEAIKIEKDSLAKAIVENYIKQVAEIDAWHEEETRKLQGLPEDQRLVLEEELALRALEKTQQAFSESDSAMKKIHQDFKEQLKDTEFKGRAEQLLKEITPEDWKKHFGNK